MVDLKVKIEFPLAEKLGDATVGFLKEILGPSAKNAGLLLSEYVNQFRLSRNIKMLKRVQEICKKNKIKINPLTIKQLVPLLEHSSLEEDDEMLDKWAILLSNLLDSEQNIKNHIFPDLLRQISRKEFEVLDTAYSNKQRRIADCKRKLEIATEKFEKMNGSTIDHREDYDIEKVELEGKIGELNYEKSRSEIIEFNLLEDYEFSNLVRLGLLKEEHLHRHSYTSFLPSTEMMVMTALGEKLMLLLQEKVPQTNN